MDVEHQEPASMLVGMQNGTNALEDSSAISYKAKRSLSCDPTIALLGIYQMTWKLMSKHKVAHKWL